MRIAECRQIKTAMRIAECLQVKTVMRIDINKRQKEKHTGQLWRRVGDERIRVSGGASRDIIFFCKALSTLGAGDLSVAS
jgi:hypothetical protein